MGNCSQVNNTTILGTSAVTYDSTPLPCTDVNTCDGLNTILSKFDAIICDVKANVDIITEDVMNLTEDVMVITEDITNIQNQLNICCPPTTTTTSTAVPTTTSTTTVVPTTTTTTSSSSTSTTTTTTTVTPTTTTTTTEFIPNLNSGSSSIQANPEIEGEGCDSLDYPYTPASSPLPPSLVAFRVTNLSVIWSDIEYVEIVSVTDDPNMVITYDGNVVAPAMQFIPATDSTWQYPLSITIDTFSCINTSETWEIRVKLTGYPISNIADATINFLTNPFCPDCVSTTTTTSTSSSTTTTTTTSIVGECRTLTYLAEEQPPSTLYVRYTNILDVVLTEEVTSLPTQDNEDGTYTVAICVKPGVEPVCVFDDGINPPVDVSCNPYSWILGGSCTSAFGCLTPPLIPCVEYEVSGENTFINWTDCDGNPQSYELTVFEVYLLCALEDTVTAPGATITPGGPCGGEVTCTTYELVSLLPENIVFDYTDCLGASQSVTLNDASTSVCAQSGTVIPPTAPDNKWDINVGFDCTPTP